MNQLQKSLRLNAIFSSLSGVLLIALNKTLANLFTVSDSSVFWIVGIGLIFFASTIAFEIKRQKRMGVILIIIQDYIWVLGSVILLIFQPFEISGIGNVIIGVVALLVLFMGVNQGRALSKIESN
tara:strand:- start:1077 stop:1451 length:375 start_codon:yes stop_codon:yes gene_type:complete